VPSSGRSVAMVTVLIPKARGAECHRSYAVVAGCPYCAEWLGRR
jgi:hypothetical protein